MTFRIKTETRAASGIDCHLQPIYNRVYDAKLRLLYLCPIHSFEEWAKHALYSQCLSILEI